MRKIRVLIVDDSAVIRKLLSDIMSGEPDIEVVGSAPDPFVAREKLLKLRPDVMTLDIEMPRMDGLTFLSKVMQHLPTRTLIFSTLSERGSETALRALELGAIEVMAKPKLNVSESMLSLKGPILDTIRLVSRSKLLGARPAAQVQSSTSHLIRTTEQILAIASSTGGTEALKRVLPLLPANTPGTVITQHMPPGFTKTFAEALSRICPFEVREAVDGDRVQPGLALLAPGNFHMEITRSGAIYQVKLHQGPTLHGVRPAADYMMNSVAKYAGRNAIGVVLTGMGKDGAEGLKAMRAAGAYTIAQDEDSCVVYGMPRAAVEAGAIDKVLPLDSIAKEVLDKLKARDAA